jgi:hypothetical protein
MSLSDDPQALAKPVPTRTRHARSRVSNGKDLFLDRSVDGRSKAARRYRDIVAAVVADLGNGAISEVRTQLVRRFAGASVLAEEMEARMALGEPIDVGEHSQLSSTSVRLASRIGIERIPKDITPSTLSDYISARRREAEAADVEDEEEQDDDECVGVSARATQQHNGDDGA